MSIRPLAICVIQVCLLCLEYTAATAAVGLYSSSSSSSSKPGSSQATGVKPCHFKCLRYLLILDRQAEFALLHAA